MMSNLVIKEKLRVIINLEMIFYQNYNLLIYLKTILAQVFAGKKIEFNIKNLNISSLKNLFNIKDLNF